MNAYVKQWFSVNMTLLMTHKNQTLIRVALMTPTVTLAVDSTLYRSVGSPSLKYNPLPSTMLRFLLSFLLLLITGASLRGQDDVLRDVELSVFSVAYAKEHKTIYLIDSRNEVSEVRLSTANILGAYKAQVDEWHCEAQDQSQHCRRGCDLSNDCAIQGFAPVLKSHWQSLCLPGSAAYRG